MNLNTITRVMAFSALTLASHLALADDVTNPGNPDSVDFQAAITADKNPCKLTVTPETGTSFSFTYSYTQADADAGALGTMTAESQPEAVKVSVPTGCSFTYLKLTQNHPPATVKLANSVGGVPTHNGGTFPLWIALSDVHFYTDSEASSGEAYGTTIRDGINRAASGPTAPAVDIVMNNSNMTYGTYNSGIIPGKSVIASGNMYGDGVSDNASVASASGIGGTRFFTSGLYKLPTANTDPTVASTDAGYITWYPTLDPAATTGNASKDTTHAYSSARFTFVPVVGLYPYSTATKAPDPLTAYDTTGGVGPITATTSLTFTPS